MTEDMQEPKTAPTWHQDRELNDIYGAPGMTTRIHLINNFGYLCPVSLTPSGNALCPICAHELESAEYDLVGTLFGGLYVCEECRTTLGATDVPDIKNLNEGFNQEEVWDELRQMWLRKTGWSRIAIDQIKHGLGIEIDLPKDQDYIIE